MPNWRSHGLGCSTSPRRSKLLCRRDQKSTSFAQVLEAAGPSLSRIYHAYGQGETDFDRRVQNRLIMKSEAGCRHRLLVLTTNFGVGHVVCSAASWRSIVMARATSVRCDQFRLNVDTTLGGSGFGVAVRYDSSRDRQVSHKRTL